MNSPKRFFQSPEPITLAEDVPLVFLEGPVQGAPDWQTPFAERLLAAVPGIAVASPRVTPEHEANFRSSDPVVKKQASERQVAYEFSSRRRALINGAMVLWYASQDMTLPYPQGRRYGKTTPIENGEVWGWMMAHPDYPFIVGFDSDFIEGGENSRGYISRNHELIGIQEHTSLDDVFNATVVALKDIKAVGSRQVPSSTSQSIQQALGRLDSR